MPDIKHSIQSSATADQIFALVTSGDGFGKWWATDIAQSGETVDLGFFNRATVYKLRMNSEMKPVHADWIVESGDEWSGTHIVFDLEANRNGTLIRFTHAGWRAETPYFISCNTTWGELMFRLKEAAEGGKPGPLFTQEGWKH